MLKIFNCPKCNYELNFGDNQCYCGWRKKKSKDNPEKQVRTDYLCSFVHDGNKCTYICTNFIKGSKNLCVGHELRKEDEEASKEYLKFILTNPTLKMIQDKNNRYSEWQSKLHKEAMGRFLMQPYIQVLLSNKNRI